MPVLYLGAAVAYIPTYQERRAVVEQQQAAYPAISVAERLAYEERFSTEVAGSMPPEVHADGPEFGEPELLEIEAVLDKEFAQTEMRRRGLQSLHDVHRSFVTEFIASPGFGISRGQYIQQRMQERDLPLPVAEPVPLPQDVPNESSGSPLPSPRLAERESASPAPDTTILETLHSSGVADFVNPRGFGYARSREFVAGFQPHRFRETPQLSVKWRVADLALVSLLKHTPPGVYISKNLPRMEDLQDVRTRSLTVFEDTAIAKLRMGEELIVDAQAEQIHMVGAIRAAKQCLQCHQVPRGELLGAFTYRLLPNSPRPQPPAPAPKVTTAGPGLRS